MERVIKIFLACAIGAGIGSMVALELNPYFWWLGLLVGGFAGYFSYEFRTVISATYLSYKKVEEVNPFRYCREISIIFFAYLLIYLTVLPILIGMDLAVVSIKGKGDIRYFLHPLPMMVLICFFLTSIFRYADYKNEETMDEWRKELRVINPLSVYFYYLPKYLQKVFSWLLIKIPKVIMVITKIIMKIVRFIKTIFILIHSDARLLCGIDAAIGAAIGYFAGSVMVGMVFGGIFGVVNYYVVSVRLLKLKAL